MKKVLIGCLGILLMLGLTVFWYLSRFDSEQDIPETAQSLSLIHISEPTRRM